MEYLSKFSERLKDLMAEHELSSYSLSEKIGTWSGVVRTWARGVRLPNLENSIKLADYFCCSLDYLTGKEEKYEEVRPRPLPPLYEHIRSVMKREGFTRYKITHDSSVKDSHFTNWAKGEMPSLPTLCILADYMKVSLDYLVGRTDY